VARVREQVRGRRAELLVGRHAGRQRRPGEAPLEAFDDVALAIEHQRDADALAVRRLVRHGQARGTRELRHRRSVAQPRQHVGGGKRQANRVGGRVGEQGVDRLPPHRVDDQRAVVASELGDAACEAARRARRAGPDRAPGGVA
jgi:hypothetical protein